MGTHALSSKDEQSHDFDTLFLLDLALFSRTDVLSSFG
jgi:hypothetical protein